MEPGKMEKAGASRKKGNVFRLGTFLLSLKFSYERGGCLLYTSDAADD